MTYDIEVFQHGGWATDMTVAGSTGKRRALDRYDEMKQRGQLVRVLDRHGVRVDQ